jgi:hypothetical protein
MFLEIDWLKRRSICRTGNETRIPFEPYEWHAMRPQRDPNAMMD